MGPQSWARGFDGVRAEPLKCLVGRFPGPGEDGNRPLAGRFRVRLGFRGVAWEAVGPGARLTSACFSFVSFGRGWAAWVLPVLSCGLSVGGSVRRVLWSVPVSVRTV